MTFRNRKDAGERLAKKLMRHAGKPDVLVLGLPRGGVVVAYEVAHALGAPLDAFLVRKLGVPGHEELAMGAVASGGVRVLNPDVLRSAGISDAELEEATARELREIARRESALRGGRPAPDARGKTVIIVDDGLATGATMRAAVQALRSLGPERIIVAVPTAPPDTVAELQPEVDQVVCLLTPWPFFAVGGSYYDFAQTSDAEVRDLLGRAALDHAKEDSMA